MAKKKIVTRHCPCCNYTYQVTTFFNDEIKHKKFLKEKELEGKEPLSKTEKALIQMEFATNGTIDDKYKDFIEIIDNPYTVEVKGETKVTKGDKPFSLLQKPDSRPPVFGGPSRSISYIGMFCPQCGVFLNIETCTTTSEECIEKKNFCGECNCSCTCDGSCKGDVKKCTSQIASEKGCSHHCGCYISKMVEKNPK